MIRLKVIRSGTGDHILPVLFSDNYVTLMPSEQTTVTVESGDADTRGEKPVVVAEGLDIE